MWQLVCCNIHRSLAWILTKEKIKLKKKKKSWKERKNDFENGTCQCDVNRNGQIKLISTNRIKNKMQLFQLRKFGFFFLFLQNILSFYQISNFNVKTCVKTFKFFYIFFFQFKRDFTLLLWLVSLFQICNISFIHLLEMRRSMHFSNEIPFFENGF